MIKLIISEQRIADTTILHLHGDITFGEGNTTLRQAIRKLLAEDKKQIHLNLRSVRYVDSSGIGELISGLTAIDREGGALKLLNLPPRLKELLFISKLLTVFDICEEQNLYAVQSFSADKLTRA